MGRHRAGDGNRVTTLGSLLYPLDYEPHDSYVTFPALAAGTQTRRITVRVAGDLFPEQPRSSA